MALQSQLIENPIGSTIVRLASPNMIAMFITLLTLMAEAWYVGQLGIISLAGLAIAFPMMMLLMMFSAGSIAGAITGAVAQRLGAGDRRGVRDAAVCRASCMRPEFAHAAGLHSGARATCTHSTPLPRGPRARF